MINSIRYFFRGVEDGIPPLLPFHIEHFIAIIIGIGLVIWTISYKNKTEKQQDRFIKGIGISMIVMQVVMNMWFILSGSFSLESSLPVYACRIVTYLFIYDIFFGPSKVRKVSIYWGLMGGILAMSFPDPYLYKFPHFTTFQFFIYHYLLLIASLFFIVVKDIKITRDDLIYALKFTFIYNLGVVAVNLLLKPTVGNVNYGFLMAPPFFLRDVIPFRGPLYTIMVIVLYLLVVGLMHLIYLFIKKLNNKAL